MAEFPDRGFVRKTICQIAALSLLGLTGALATSSVAHAQAASPPGSNSVRRDKSFAPAVSPSAAVPVVPAPVAPVTPVDAPPEPVTAAQMPPQPPVIAWDGTLLSIDAENSTLADILNAVGKHTGASMELPPSASRERVFVHLGPGSVRDVISALLYGTGFDYIVAASEDDPDTLHSLVLTARGKEDDSAVGSFADASGVDPTSIGAGAAFRGSIAQGVAPREGMRMMRGWAGPGKPAFQANAEAALAAEQAAKESGEVSDTADANATNPATPTADSASAGHDLSGSDPQPSASATSPGNTSSGTDIPLATASSSSASDSSDQTGAVSGMIQNMTHMFEQRRQIQSQQNQAVTQQQSQQ